MCLGLVVSMYAGAIGSCLFDDAAMLVLLSRHKLTGVAGNRKRLNRVHK